MNEYVESGSEEQVIDMRPDWIRVREVATGTVDFQDKPVLYTVWSSTEAKNLPGWNMDGEDALRFVGYFEGHVYISDAVPEELREHWVRHELRCQGVYAEEGVGACQKALEEEMQEVPAFLKEMHIQFRKALYDRLVVCYKPSAGQTSPLYDKIARGNEYLQTL